MNLKAVVIVTTCMVWCLTNAYYTKKQLIPAITHRIEYVSLETSLWEYLEQTSNTNEAKKLKKVIDSHLNMVDSNQTSDYNPLPYLILDEFYEWNHVVSINLNEIDGLFQYFRKMLNRYRYGDYNQDAIMEFTREALDQNEKGIHIIEKLQSIHNIMIKQTLYYRAQLESRNHICSTSQSSQQFIYSLYSDIALTELKGYMMMQFSWMMLRAYNMGNFTEEATAMRIDYEKRTKTSIEFLKKVMARSDRHVWKCDSKPYVKGENYDEVTRLLQGYVENEVDMNADGTCRENCAHYEVAQSYGCFKDLYCSRQPKCAGKLLDCRYIDSDMSVCPSPANSLRRYEYIEFESGQVFGKKTACARGTTKVESWWRYLFWHCSYCFCICDEKGLKSDRYFNLRETISDIDNNMVVTGLRLIKVKRVFHLQIQEGQLLPRGNINVTTLRWKPVEEYNIFDRNVENGRDYHTLDTFKRAVDLDDVVADDPTHVVTGVKFRMLGVHLNLEVRFCEYEFHTGKLISPRETTFWKSNDNTQNSNTDRRTEINVQWRDVPIRSPATSQPISKNNQYLKFEHSAFDSDAAQSTVPFIDIQPVVSKPPVPLSGVGLLYKGRKGYGGFLAPKLITYDFTKHIEVPLTD